MREYLYAVLFSCIAASAANADIHIADQMRFEVLNTAFQINAGSEVYFDLGNASVGDKFEVSIQSTNGFFPDISAYICLKGSNQDCLGYTKVKAPYNFYVDITKPGPYILKFDNTYSVLTNKKGFAAVSATLNIDANTHARFTQILQSFERQIFSTFQVSKFNMSLKPCGQANAFSQHDGGHITICSELFLKLVSEQKLGALAGIFFHELGHSLLNLWGQPNWKNEETVDEFAIVMMYWDGIQERAFDWVAYYEAKNSVNEANYIIQNGDTHPLSIQRARNARHILNNPAGVVQRWNQFLYPYLTTSKLKGLVDNPSKYDDSGLATTVLQTRTN